MLADFRFINGAKSEWCEIEHAPNVIEQADSDGFAVNRRDRGDAKIEPMLINTDTRTSILRQATLGDIQTG